MNYTYRGYLDSQGENKWLNVIIRIVNVLTVNAVMIAVAATNAASPDTNANK